MADSSVKPKEHLDRDLEVAIFAQATNAPCIICGGRHGKPVTYGSFRLNSWRLLELRLPQRPTRIGYALCAACLQDPDFAAKADAAIIDQLRSLPEEFPAADLGSGRISFHRRPHPMSAWN